MSLFGTHPLWGEADPDVDYFGAIERFAEERFAAYARKVVHAMQREVACGIFGDSIPLKTFWDEVCWFCQKGYEDTPADTPLEMAITAYIESVVEKIPETEAVLMSCAASQDQDGMPDRSDHELCRALGEYVSEIAASRSLEAFEIY